MNDGALRQLLQQRLLALEDRLTTACQRSGRQRRDVTLVAVTKSITPELAALLPGLGVTDLGESRPQELWRKAAAIPSGIRWHMIGHLQRNKIERTLPLVHIIHAVDSIRLLHAIDKEAKRQGRTVPVLIEVNISGETSKQGLAPEAVEGLSEILPGLRNVQVRGLMTMAALQDAEACRPGFARLRRLRDQLQERLGLSPRLEHLSMGMSNDFEVAIEEGATLVRLGTVLFDGLEDEPR